MLKVVARKNKAKVTNEEIDNIMFEFEFTGSEVVEEKIVNKDDSN